MDPGPRLNQIRSTDPGYQQTVQDTHATLDQFRAMLPADGTPRLSAMIKTRITEGDESALMWLHNARASAGGFEAELFEVPAEFTQHAVGQALFVTKESLLDWMVNDNGALDGDYSIRYYRATLPDEERQDYDDYIGVREYA